MELLYFFLLILIPLILLLLFFTRATLSQSLKKEERKTIALYRKKIDKIPAFLETMRDKVAEEASLKTMIRLHSEAVLMPTNDIVDVLEMNVRIEKEFHFLMQISAQIPALLTETQFIYIRDFVIQAEKDMHAQFSAVNEKVQKYNTFIMIKNLTIIGLILPGKAKPYLGT